MAADENQANLSARSSVTVLPERTMRGVVYIERENTDGDRRTVRTLDVEGFSVTLGDPMEVIKAAVRDAHAEPAVYRVRAIHDYRDANPRTIYSLSVEDTRRRA